MVTAEPFISELKGVSMDPEDNVNDDDLKLDEADEELDLPEGDETEGDESDDQATEDEVLITIDGEAPPASEEVTERAPKWVSELRKSNREKDRRIRELEQKVTASVPAKVELGEEPTLEGCDYDADKFKADFREWLTRKGDAEAQAQRRKRAEDEAMASFQTTVNEYEKAKTVLKVRDFGGAEDVFKDTFNQTQQGLLLDAAESAESAARLVYVLGSNPAKAKQLASLVDKPVKFVAAVVKLESQLKVTPRKSAPAPERSVRGNAPARSAIDSQLERLRNEADRTGDRSKVVAYMKQQKAKS